MQITEEMRQRLLGYQKSEITEHHIYSRLAGTVRSAENRRVLEHIAEDELRHYQQWRAYTQQDVAPGRWSVWKYYVISRVLGFTFGAKLMEETEGDIQGSYAQLRDVIPEADAIIKEEKEHETALLQMLDEERLRLMENWTPSGYVQMTAESCACASEVSATPPGKLDTLLLTMSAKGCP